MIVRSYHELSLIQFEDLPISSESRGKGIHRGKRFRSALLEAVNSDGRWHRYTLRITRFMAPTVFIEMQLASAEDLVGRLRDKDINRTRDFGSYQLQLEAAMENVCVLSRQLEQAKIKSLPAPADARRIIDHGVTAHQLLQDRRGKADMQAQRPSSAYLEFLMDGLGVSVNATQYQIIADYVEGLSDKPPFFFMGMEWLPALKKVNAIESTPEGEKGCGQRLRNSYQTFSSRQLCTG